MKPLLPRSEWLQTLSRKRAGGCVLFTNTNGQVLITKPNYRDFWLLPGGNSEKNESPRQTAIREVAEELGLDITICELACISYTYNTRDKEDILVFVFDGGTLSDTDIASITLQTSELDEYMFVDVADAGQYVHEVVADRINASCKARETGVVQWIENEVDVL